MLMSKYFYTTEDADIPDLAKDLDQMTQMMMSQPHRVLLELVKL
jgi:hypothetical protein